MEPRDQSSRHRHPDTHRDRRRYWRFAAMIATSTGTMFLLTYSNVYQLEHGRFSQERVYLALLMGSAVALVVLSFLASSTYRDRASNVVVVVAAVVVAGSAYSASRAQLLVDDQRYLGAMIPHHSGAILTSERADLDDVRVRALADSIVATRRLEIDRMDWLLEDIKANGPATTRQEAAQRPVPDVGPSAVPGRPDEAALEDDRARLAAALASLLRLVGPVLEREAS